jgi:hypothetical protein
MQSPPLRGAGAVAAPGFDLSGTHILLLQLYRGLLESRAAYFEMNRCLQRQPDRDRCRSHIEISYVGLQRVSG